MTTPQVASATLCGDRRLTPRRYLPVKLRCRRLKVVESGGAGCVRHQGELYVLCHSVARGEQSAIRAYTAAVRPADGCQAGCSTKLKVRVAARAGMKKPDQGSTGQLGRLLGRYPRVGALLHAAAAH